MRRDFNSFERFVSAPAEPDAAARMVHLPECRARRASHPRRFCRQTPISKYNQNSPAPCGELAEWLMAPVLKTGILERVSGVRIPRSPPLHGTDVLSPLAPDSPQFIRIPSRTMSDPAFQASHVPCPAAAFERKQAAATEPVPMQLAALENPTSSVLYHFRMQDQLFPRSQVIP
jgi:hypothetical protein